MKLPTVLLDVTRLAAMMTKHWLLLLTCSIAKYHGRRSLVPAVTVLAHITIVRTTLLLVVGAEVGAVLRMVHSMVEVPGLYNRAIHALSKYNRFHKCFWSLDKHPLENPGLQSLHIQMSS